LSRSNLLLALAIAFPAIQLADSEDLQNEDLQAIQTIFRSTDPSLNWFRVIAKKPVDATYSVMAVQVGPTSSELGVFVVSGKANQVRLVLDRLPRGSTNGYPTLELLGANSAYLHFYSDYGIYEGSIKYIYDLAGSQSPVKIPYSITALTDSWLVSGDLYYAASFGREEHKIIVIEPRSGDASPSFKLMEGEGRKQGQGEEGGLHGPAGEIITLADTPLGQTHQPSGFRVRSGAIEKFYPVPVPSMAQHREAVPEKQAPAEIENDIGPYVQAGGKIWFANTFYDREGFSGVGAIGEFDIASRKFEMHYLPDIVPWSGSAILLDGDELWIGLMRRPEGAEYSAGLLRYNIRTGDVSKLPLADLVNSIDRVGSAMYFGTSQGLYVLRGGKFTQFRFEPDASGKIVMIARAIR
jgi:hypothetical protein